MTFMNQFTCSPPNQSGASINSTFSNRPYEGILVDRMLHKHWIWVHLNAFLSLCTIAFFRFCWQRRDGKKKNGKAWHSLPSLKVLRATFGLGVVIYWMAL